MKHTVKIIFGKEQITKIYNNETFTDEELRINVKKYSFNSIEEKEAFINGINEAVGWMECFFTEFEFSEVT